MQAIVEDHSEVGVRQEVPSGYDDGYDDEGGDHDYYGDGYNDEDEDGYGREEGDLYYQQHQQDLSRYLE